MVKFARKLINKLFHQKGNTLFRSALIIMVATLISKVIGFLRLKVLASTFGASGTLDAYFSAFQIFDSIYKLMVVGIIFIPEFIEVKTKKPKKLWDFSSAIITLIGTVYIFLALVAFVFTKQLVELVSPGFAAEYPDLIPLTIMFVRIMLVQPFIFAVSAITGSVLHSYKRFIAVAVAPIIYNLGIIFGAVVLTKFMGKAGLGWGVVFGAVLYLAIQIPSLVKVGFKYKPNFNWKMPEVVNVLKVAFPRILSMAVMHLNFIVINRFASYLVAGTITSFYFANDFQGLFISVLGVSLSTAMFPTFSENVAQEKKESLRRNIKRIFRQIVFWCIPITFFLPFVAKPLIFFFLKGRAFESADSNQVAIILAWFALGIGAYTILPTILKAYYAFKDTRTPFFTGLLSLIVNWVTCWALVRVFDWGVSGLAIAFSLAGIIHLGALILLLRFRKKINLFEGILWPLVFKTSLASGLAICLPLILNYFLDASYLFQLISIIILGGFLFVLFAYWFKIKEFRFVRQKMFGF